MNVSKIVNNTLLTTAITSWGLASALLYDTEKRTEKYSNIEEMPEEEKRIVEYENSGIRYLALIGSITFAIWCYKNDSDNDLSNIF